MDSPVTPSVPGPTKEKFSMLEMNLMMVMVNVRQRIRKQHFPIIGEAAYFGHEILFQLPLS
jgi:hypothetical protein